MDAPQTDFGVADDAQRVRDIAIGLKAMYERVVNVAQQWEMPDATYERLIAIADEALDHAFALHEDEHPELLDTEVRDAVLAYVTS